jgi:two-component system, cell cycle response regulator DivK
MPTPLAPEEAYVLVIEDDSNNIMVVTDLLRMIGIKSINARTSGRMGIKLAETLPRLDLILLDIQLPYENGYAVLQHIRLHPKLKEIRVIAVTSNVLPQDEAKARLAGFDGFIGKPLDLNRFPQQILSVLQGNAVWSAR